MISTDTAPIVLVDDLILVKGQDYVKRHDAQITFEDDGDNMTWPSMPNAFVAFSAFGEEFDMEVLVDNSEDPKKVGLDLKSTDTLSLVLNRYPYMVTVQLTDGTLYVLAKGRVVFK